MRTITTYGGKLGSKAAVKNSSEACHSKGLEADTTSVYFSTPDEQGKAIATQIARLALADHAVHKGSAGDFTVCKYGSSRYRQDFVDPQTFARQLGVNHGL